MNWLFSKKSDLAILFLPVWLCWLAAFMLPSEWINQEAPLWVWVLFVLGIDVSHVWSSIFRTYLDKEEFGNHKRLLTWAPIISFVLATAIASISIFWFWRILAYVAVYHFVKQQYGFMRMYKAKAGDFQKQWLSDSFIIYLSMLYPILYWHLRSDRVFSWFIQGDFFTLSQSPASVFFTIGNTVYLILVGLWLMQEFSFKKKIAWGKVLWILTTWGNWYLGIVFFNSELVFTITNVVAHGVPYVALVIFYQERKSAIQNRKILPYYPVMVVGVILALALVEEYFWDAWINHENLVFFGSFLPYQQVSLPPVLLALVTALLAVPQITHYIIDGYIWKNNSRNPHLKKILFNT